MATKKNPIVPAVEVEEVPCCGKDECLDCPIDDVAPAPAPEPILEAPEKAVEAPKATGSYIAKDGDTYASIAADNLPKGMKKHDYALQLVAKNKGKALAAGTPVAL
jgi:hypothetical protein